MTADTTAVLRAELTRRLASHLPPAAIAPVAEAAVQAIADWTASPGDAPDAAMARYVHGIALAACPPQYRWAIEAAGVVAQAVSAWLAARVVEVEAGSVTVMDYRRD